MKLFNSVKNVSRRLGGKKLAVTAAVLLTVASAGLVGVTSLNNNKVYAGDCSGNSIIKCGEPNRQSFINFVKGHPEEQNIYAHFGLSASDYSRFVSSAKLGYAYRDNNTIVVGNTVVATNVGSIGRWASFQGSGYHTFVIAGHTYYGNLNQKSMSPNSPRLPVEVLFNSQGKMQFAVMMSSCANPTYGTPTYPPVCKELNSKALGNNKFQFTTSITPGDSGVGVNKVVYNFGDGTTATSTSAPYTVSHTFTKSTTVTAIVYVNVAGGGIAVSSHCTKKITFTPPPAVFACEALDLTPGKMNEDGSQTYTLTVHGSAKNATITGYTFYFGDMKGPKSVSTSATSFSVTHDYAPGSYSANATITVQTDTGAVKSLGSPACRKPVNVKPPVSILACTDLTLDKGSVAANGATAYTLHATASASHATITSYAFNFGDGQSQTVNTGATTASSSAHTYAVGDFTASVTVHGTDFSGKPITATSAACSKPVHVAPVASTLACVNLTLTKGAVAANGSTVYTLNAAASANNATITSYVFHFGDNTANQTVTTGATTASSAPHTYAVGDFTASVTVKGHDVNGNPLSVSAPACSKPVHVPPVTSNLTCVSLGLVPGDKASDGSQLFTLNATASKNNATITSYVFNFGDNSQNTTVMTGALTASTTHTYAPGNYTASVTVNGTDANGHQVSATSPACSQPLTVTPPNQPTPGISIVKTVDHQPSEQVKVGQQFEYEIVVTNTGQVDLTNAAVTDQTPAGVTLLSADLGTIANNQWSYTIPSLTVGQSMTFHLVAVVNTYVPGTLVNTACVNVPPVTPPNQPECSTATVTVTPPVTPTPPTTLVNTGAGSVLGLFGASAVIGTLGYRLFLSRRLGRQ